MNVAYIRVSALDQNTGRQFEALKPYNIERTFVEKISGKNMQRPELTDMLTFVRAGDILYIESISRLARNTRDFLTIVEQLKQKEVTLISLKESIDTNTPQGRFMLSVFAALSELERETLKERQKEGIALVKAQGLPQGRPKAKVTDKLREAYRRWKGGEITAGEAMKRAEMKRTTFYKLVKQME